MTQGVHEQIRVVPAIESESHLRAVCLKVFGANAVPTAHDAALQERESGLDSISVGVAFGVDAELVPNGLVSAVFPNVLGRALVGVPIVGVQDVHADVLPKRSAPRIFGMEETQFAAALTDANYSFFSLVERVLALPPILAADKSFIHFDFAVEHGSLRFDHRGSDA